MFGSSGGAVTGLALVTRHPDRVRTLIAHEPPLLELLPDAPQRRVAIDDMIDTFHREGLGPAWMKFMINAGFDLSAAPAPPPGPPSQQALLDGGRFFDHELRGTTRYLPDATALTAGRTRLVLGIGATSDHLVTYRTSIALADLLGVPTVEFPGDHGGFIGQPEEFAGVLRKVLAT